MHDRYDRNHWQDVAFAQEEALRTLRKAADAAESRLARCRREVEARDARIQELLGTVAGLRLAAERAKRRPQLQAEHDAALLRLTELVAENWAADGSDPNRLGTDDASRIAGMRRRLARIMQDPRGRFPDDLYAVVDAAHAGHRRRHELARLRTLAERLVWEWDSTDPLFRDPQAEFVA